MKNYINNTRTDSILTVNVESSEDLKAQSAEPGNKDVFAEVLIGIGINDIDVPAGKEVRFSNNTVATFLAVRSALR